MSESEPKRMRPSEVAVYVHHHIIEHIESMLPTLDACAQDSQAPTHDRNDAQAIAGFIRQTASGLRQTNELILRSDKAIVLEAGELPHDARQPIHIPGTVLPRGGE